MKKDIIKISSITLTILVVIFSWSYFKDDDKRVDSEEKRKEEVIQKYEETSLNVTNQENIVLEYQKSFNNRDIVAELYIPNTKLKVPVAHYSDNKYYLDHLLDKSYSTLGSIFLDYRNTTSDRKIIIYGHNSQDVETEFRFLENYLNYEYYQEHSDIYLRTINDNYHYKIFSVYVATSDFRHVNLKFNDEGYFEHLKWLKAQAVYDTLVDIKPNDEIIVLQTCYFEPLNSYLIVAAKKI